MQPMTPMKQRLRFLLMASVAGATLATGSALAQDQDQDQDQDAEVEEILITSARRREENVYDTPAALSVFDSAALRDRGITSVEDVGKHVPNLSIARFGVGNTSQAAPFIRGIGTNDHLITTDPGVGVYLDGVYLGRQLGNNLNITNVARVEVLRGPQGTLYGRNTLGGAINIITRQPGDEEHFEFTVGGGTRGRLTANFYGNTKLADNFAVSFTGGYTRRNGVGDALNIDIPEARIGEINRFFGRVAAKWEVSEDFRITASLDGQRADDGQSPFTAEILPGGPAPGFGIPVLTEDDFAEDEDDIFLNAPGLESTDSSVFGVSLTAEYDINENFTTKFLASFRESEYTGGLDDDATLIDLSNFPEEGQAEQVSLEWQLNGKVGDVEFVSGAYYFHEDGDNFSGPFTFLPFNTSGPNDFFTLEQETNSWAVFANASYYITERLTIGGGVRYSEDDKEATALFPSFGGIPDFEEEDFGEVTWDANVTYALTDTLNVYGQIQRGYQTGGFPPRPFGGPDIFEPFDETTVLNYEIGIKGIVNEYLSFAAAGFFTDYDDLSVDISVPDETGFLTVTENPDAEAFGIELEVNLNYAGFFLNLSGGYIETEILDAAGLIEANVPLPGTPKYTASVNGGYTTDFAGGSLTLQANYSFRDDFQSQPTTLESEVIEERSLVGYNVTYTSPDGSWDLVAYGTNIFNEVYDQGRIDISFLGFVEVVRSNDRSEFGVRFTKRFNGF